MMGGGAFCHGQKIHSIETNLVSDHLLMDTYIIIKKLLMDIYGNISTCNFFYLSRWL